MSGPPAPKEFLRTAHLVVGAITIVLFVLTGQYMHWVHGHLVGMDDGPRLFMRSVHIYLLWSGIANALFGCHFERAPRGALRHLQGGASLLLLAAPPMLAYSFFFEAYNADLARPASWWANVLAFVGTVVQFLVTTVGRRRVRT